MWKCKVSKEENYGSISEDFQVMRKKNEKVALVFYLKFKRKNSYTSLYIYCIAKGFYKNVFAIFGLTQ